MTGFGDFSDSRLWFLFFGSLQPCTPLWPQLSAFYHHLFLLSSSFLPWPHFNWPSLWSFSRSHHCCGSFVFTITLMSLICLSSWYQLRLHPNSRQERAYWEKLSLHLMLLNQGGSTGGCMSISCSKWIWAATCLCTLRTGILIEFR